TQTNAWLNTSVTVGGTVKTTTEVDSQNLFELALLSTEMRAIGVSLEGDAGLLMGTIQVANLIPSLYVGVISDNHLCMHIDSQAGLHSDIRLGHHGDLHFIMHECLHQGIHADLHLGLHTETHIGPHVQMDLENTKLQDSTIEESKARVQSLIGME